MNKALKFISIALCLLAPIGCARRTPPIDNLTGNFITVDGFVYERIITPRTFTFFYVDETGAHSKSWKMMSKVAETSAGAAFVEDGGTVVIVSGSFLIEKESK